MLALFTRLTSLLKAIGRAFVAAWSAVAHAPSWAAGLPRRIYDYCKSNYEAIGTALGIVVSIFAIVGGAVYGWIWLTGPSFTYGIATVPNQLRFGEQATLTLQRRYGKQDSVEYQPVADRRCRWSYQPAVATAETGDACAVKLMDSAADFAQRSDTRIEVSVAVRSYRPGEAPPLETATADATTRITLLREYEPRVAMDQRDFAPGKTARISVEFPDKGAPAAYRCHWSANPPNRPETPLFADPDKCDTTFTAPVDGDGEMRLEVAVFPGNGEKTATAATTVRVQRPVGRYFLFVADYTTRMMAQKIGPQTMFESMQAELSHAIGYIGDLGGGFVGLTAFGGATPGAAPDCASVHRLYPLRPLVPDTARKSLAMRPGGVDAPLYDAVKTAWNDYVPLRDANRTHPADRFFFVVITGGPDSCGHPQMADFLKDAMSPGELQGLVVDERLLRIVLALVTRQNAQRVDDLLQSPEYGDDRQRTPILKIGDGATLNRALTDLGRIASREPSNIVAGCRDLEAAFRSQKDKKGESVVTGFCRRLT